MFALYNVPESSREWQFVRAVALAGLLADRILEEAATKRPGLRESMPWEISGAELRQRVVKASIRPNEQQRGQYKLVIDATYTRQDSQLFEIWHVWGYADPEWSPLAFRLSDIYRSNTRPRGSATPVERFEPTDHCGIATHFVHEFLYLQHGHQGGKKAWGRMGYTNAALLWQPHLEHLLAKLGFTRTFESGP